MATAAEIIGKGDSLDIDRQMEQNFGPKAIILPNNGPRFHMNGKGVIGQIKLGPGEYPHYKFTAVRFDL